MSLKKIAVPSAKFTILILCSLICILLILLLALMKLASISAAIMYKGIENIGVYIFNRVNEFVSISEVMQRRKNKIPINFKDITERFLFSSFDTSIM